MSKKRKEMYVHVARTLELQLEDQYEEIGSDARIFPRIGAMYTHDEDVKIIIDEENLKLILEKNKERIVFHITEMNPRPDDSNVYNYKKKGSR